MDDDTFLEKIMRYTVPALALSLAFATVSSVGLSRAPDNVINPRSSALVTQAKADVAANRLDIAIDALETALAVDPRNREAYMTLASVARKQQLPGKAIRFYREALLIDPNDINALSAQGETMVQKGALAKAKENLSRIEKLCLSSCPQQAQLAASIAKGPAQPVVAVQSVKPAPVITEAPKPKPE